MYVEIDQGNTRLKWRFQDSTMRSGTIKCLQQQLNNTHVHMVRMVSVCSEHRRQQLINSVITHVLQPLEWRIASSTNQCMQVRNAYNNPEQLGADRWSALVAAAYEHQKPQQPIAVFGCGSAITLDLIDQDKQHLGGCIAPGFAAQQYGLRHTTNLHFNQIEKITVTEPAINTQHSIEWGLHMQLNGLICQMVNYCQDRFASRWSLIVHGGNAPTILPYIQTAAEGRKIDTTFCPELVLDGLKYITADTDNG